MPLASDSTPHRKRLLAAGMLVALLALCPCSSSAGTGRMLTPEFLVVNWDMDQGLPSSRINGLVRAPDGYLWLATAMGVVRFDGQRFVSFNSQNTPCMTDNHVLCLAMAPDGTLWAGAENGTLIRRGRKGFTTVGLGRAMEGKNINSMALDPRGALWLATRGAGLLRFAGGRVEAFGRTNGVPMPDVSKVLVDSRGRVWLVAGGTLASFEDGRCRPAESLAARRVWTIANARDGGLWVAMAARARGNTGTVIVKLKDGRCTPEPDSYPWPQGSLRSRAGALLEDSAGRLWCATPGGGVFIRPRGAAWQPLAPEAPLAQAETLCLEPDESDTVWIGTRTAGLHQVRPRSVISRHLPISARQHALLTVCVARDGSIWGGTDGAGIFRWHSPERAEPSRNPALQPQDPNVPTHYGGKEGLTNLTVPTLLEDSRTNLWAGTLRGLFRLYDGRFAPVSGPPALRWPVLALFEDRQHRLWVGSHGALVCLDHGRSTMYGSGAGLPPNNICGLAEDGEGRLWVAAGPAGLYCQTGRRFKPYVVQAGGGDTNFYSFRSWSTGGEARTLLRDADGGIWLGTQGGGLYRLRDGHIEQWRWAEDGLPSNHLFALLQDQRQNLWLSSENGIFGLSQALLARYRRGQSPRLTPWRLMPAEGLAYKVCSGLGQPAAAKSPDGRLWFADGPALAGFKPAAITATSPHARRPLVEELVVDGLRLAPGPSGEFRVKSGARRFEFHYTSPDIFSPEQLRFLVRLEGLDKEWVDAEGSRVAHYDRLPPGNYQFQVQAREPGGAWQEVEHSLRLRVLPRFYERRSVQLAGALLLLGGVAGGAWGFERARSRRRLERLHFQRAMDQERQRIARDIHDDLGSGLTEIILLGDSLREETPQTAAWEKMAREIPARARALTRAMDEVVWAINPRNDTLEQLLNYLSDFAQEHLTLAGLRCRWDLPLEIPDLALSAEARHHLYLGCKEALNNVVKHAAASEVWLRLALRPEGFTLSVEDNGCGFVPTSPVARGNGLPNIRRRLAELGGTCEIDSRPGTGTRVHFSMPVSPKCCPAPERPVYD